MFPALNEQSAGMLLRENPEKLITAMLDLPQAECPVTHHFAPGIYIREVRFPAGIFVVGHEQRFPQMNVFIQGKVQMLKDDGTTQILEAPSTFFGTSGRKMGLIMEDVIWQNIYPNPSDEQDIEKLEDHWLNQTPCFEAFKAQRFLVDMSARADYEQMLLDLGVTAEQVQAESDITTDMIPFPPGWGGVAVRRSNIEGHGLFAERSFKEGEIIAPARINGHRTPAGRCTNHSGTPNAKFVRFNVDDLGLVALRDIGGRMGGMNGEEITIDYRQAYAVARKELS